MDPALAADPALPPPLWYPVTKRARGVCFTRAAERVHSGRPVCWPCADMTVWTVCTAVDPPAFLYMGKDKFENEDLIAYGYPEDIW